MAIRPPEVRWDHILLGEKGGEDMVATGMSAHPSRPFYTHNMEWLASGGLARLQGYLKYDGQATNMAAVPGSGPVRGVAVYGGTVWAWRNNAGGTALVMHKATAGGWVAQTLGVALAPGGRVETVVANFSGSATGQKLYGVDGKNKAFAWDGTTYTQITSGATTDTPTHIEAHGYRLWLGLPGGLVRYSPVGDPTGTWADSVTSGVIGLGEEITGLVSLPGGALGLYGANAIALLYGSVSGASGDLQLKPHGLDVGARAHTLARFANDVLFLDRMGVQSLATTQNFGDFRASVVSDDLRPFFESRRGAEKAALALHDKGQYRIWFDGEGGGSPFAIATWRGSKLWWSRGRYAIDVECAGRGEISGDERLFVGAADGAVYEIDTGTTFAGVAYRSTVAMAYANQRAAGVAKSYRRLRLEGEALDPIEIQCQPIYDYGTGPKGLVQGADLEALGDRWGDGIWGSLTWGGPDVSVADGYLSGWADTLSLTLTATSSTARPFVLRALSYQYTARRPLR